MNNIVIYIWNLKIFYTIPLIYKRHANNKENHNILLPKQQTQMLEILTSLFQKNTYLT